MRNHVKVDRFNVSRLSNLTLTSTCTFAFGRFKNTELCYVDTSKLTFNCIITVSLNILHEYFTRLEISTQSFILDGWPFQDFLGISQYLSYTGVGFLVHRGGSHMMPCACRRSFGPLTSSN